MKKLLAFGRFTHDPQRVLAAIGQFALVLVKHDLEFTFGQYRRVVIRLEGLIAVFTDGCQRKDEPHQTQSPLQHSYSLAHLVGETVALWKANGTTTGSTE